MDSGKIQATNVNILNYQTGGIKINDVHDANITACHIWMCEGPGLTIGPSYEVTVVGNDCQKKDQKGGETIQSLGTA